MLSPKVEEGTADGGCGQLLVDREAEVDGAAAVELALQLDRSVRVGIDQVGHAPSGGHEPNRVAALDQDVTVLTEVAAGEQELDPLLRREEAAGEPFVL